MGKVEGTRLFIRSVFSNDLAVEYDWLHHCAQYMVPGSEGFNVQGVWDRWPDVAPALRQVELILDTDPPVAGDRILDVGSGYGGFADACLERCPEVEAFVGVELNPDYVVLARERGLPDKVQFLNADARSLEPAADPALAQALAPGFSKIYLVEVSQDLQSEEFDSVLSRCNALLREGGVLHLFVLTLDERPQGRLERLVGDMVVRSGAPDLASIRTALDALGLDVAERNLTAVSTRMLLQRVLDDRSICRQVLPWPLSALLQKAMGVGQQMVAREAYAVTMLVARKPVAT